MRAHLSGSLVLSIMIYILQIYNDISFAVLEKFYHMRLAYYTKRKVSDNTKNSWTEMVLHCIY